MDGFCRKKRVRRYVRAFIIKNAIAMGLQWQLADSAANFAIAIAIVFAISNSQASTLSDQRAMQVQIDKATYSCFPLPKLNPLAPQAD